MHTQNMISDDPKSVNAFDEELWQKIKSEVAQIKSQFKPPYIAAFDADGTLWSADVGDLLYEKQKSLNVFKLNPEEIIEIENKFLSEKKLEEYYIWQSELNDGFSKKQVAHWVQVSQEGVFPDSLFTPMKELISYMQSESFETYVVSASYVDCLIPATTYLGISAENHIGAEIPLVDGVYKAPMKKAMTGGEGKVERLLEVTNGINAHFCAGNTMSDFALLKSAQSTRLAVCSVSPTHLNFASESRLQEEADSHGWLKHQF